MGIPLTGRLVFTFIQFGVRGCHLGNGRYPKEGSSNSVVIHLLKSGRCVCVSPTRGYSDAIGVGDADKSIEQLDRKVVKTNLSLTHDDS